MTELHVPEGVRRAAKWVGYPAFALVVMMMSLYFALPRDRIKERIETLAGGALNADVSIDNLGLTFFTGPGVDAEGIVIRTRPTTSSEKPQRYVVDEVVVHPNVIDAIRQRLGGRLTAQLAGGTVRARGTMNSEETAASLEAHTLGLAQVPGVARGIGLPVEGTLDVTGEVKLPKGLAAQAVGLFELLCEGCVVGDGKAKLVVPSNPLLAAGLTIPRLKLGRIQGSVVIDKGRATFKDLHGRSSDVELALEGYIELRDPLPFSVLHLYLRFKLAPALVQREPTLELVSTALGGQGRRPDGFLGLAITGTLQTPLVLPSSEPPTGVSVGKLPTVGLGAPPPARGGLPPIAPVKPGSTFAPPPKVLPPGVEDRAPSEEAVVVPPNVGTAAPPPGDNPNPVQLQPANAVPPPAAGFAGGGEGAAPPPGGEEAPREPENPAPENPSRE
jgi:type II secretion system protein N